eukprot:scpid28071/ scgid16569/ 
MDLIASITDHQDGGQLPSSLQQHTASTAQQNCSESSSPRTLVRTPGRAPRHLVSRIAAIAASPLHSSSKKAELARRNTVDEDRTNTTSSSVTGDKPQRGLASMDNSASHHQDVLNQLRMHLGAAEDCTTANSPATQLADRCAVNMDTHSISDLLQKVYAQMEGMHAKIDRMDSAITQLSARFSPPLQSHAAQMDRSVAPMLQSVAMVDLPHSATAVPAAPCSVQQAALAAASPAAVSAMADSEARSRAKGILSTPRKRKRFMQLGITDVRQQRSFSFAKQITSRIGSRVKKGSENESEQHSADLDTRDTYSQPAKRVLGQKTSMEALGLDHSLLENRKSIDQAKVLPSTSAGRIAGMLPIGDLQKPLPSLPTPLSAAGQANRIIPCMVATNSGDNLAAAPLTVTTMEHDSQQEHLDHQQEQQTSQTGIQPVCSFVSAVSEQSPTGDADYAIMSSSLTKRPYALSHSSFASDCFGASTGCASTGCADLDDMGVSNASLRSPFIQLAPADADRSGCSPVYQRIQSRCGQEVLPSDGIGESNIDADSNAVASEPLSQIQSPNTNSGDYDRVSRQSVFSEIAAAVPTNAYSSPSIDELPPPPVLYALPSGHGSGDKAAKENFRKMFMAVCNRAVKDNTNRQTDVMHIIRSAQDMGFLSDPAKEPAPQGSLFTEDIIYGNNPSESSSMMCEETSNTDYPPRKRVKSTGTYQHVDPYGASRVTSEPLPTSSSAHSSGDDLQGGGGVGGGGRCEPIFIDQGGKYISAAGLQQRRSRRRNRRPLDSNDSRRGSAVSQTSVFSSSSAPSFHAYRQQQMAAQPHHGTSKAWAELKQPAPRAPPGKENSHPSLSTRFSVQEGRALSSHLFPNKHPIQEPFAFSFSPSKAPPPFRPRSNTTNLSFPNAQHKLN